MTVAQKLLTSIAANPDTPLSYAQLAKLIENPSPFHCGQVIRSLVRKGNLSVVRYLPRIGTIYAIPPAAPKVE